LHIKEVSRVLRRGGYFVTGGHNNLPFDFQFMGLFVRKGVHLVSWFWLKKHLQKNGFKILKVYGTRGLRIPNLIKPHWMILAQKT
jgi:hypothetical protein